MATVTGWDKLKKERSQVRRLFTRTIGQLKDKLKENTIDKIELESSFKVLEDKAERLFRLDEEIRETWLCETQAEEEAYQQDYDDSEAYRDEYIIVRTRYENVIQTVAVDQVCEVNSGILQSPNRNFRLPKLELTKFDGNVKNWIGFWGQFRKIDEDNSLDDDDKFQYLLQAMVPGSKARELVESFPPSGVNYQHAIEQLKSRFAKDELLIEIYVRELLSLVLNQATGRESMPLSTLHDKLETQLRALETLGVTHERYSAMLYPLVESSLPEDVMLAWERARNSRAEQEERDILASLLAFLRLEVESEERFTLARSGFSFQSDTKSSVSKLDQVPTAACILASGSKTSSKDACLWCDKSSHTSLDCFNAKKLTIEAKKNLLKQKGRCYLCFKVGHNAKKCKCFVKCLICEKRHVTIMCPQLCTEGKQVPNNVSKDSHHTGTDSLLSQQGGQTLLQTLIVSIVTDRTTRLARVLLDSGSQRSYIVDHIPRELDLKCLGQETLSHNLFGGSELREQEHMVYEIRLRSLDKKFECTVPLLNQKKICNFVPRLKTQKIFPQLKNANITLTDQGHDVPDVEILLGADTISKLWTGGTFQIDDDMMAIETRLGWTIMGCKKSTKGGQVIGLTNVTFSLKDLWELDVLGIQDPVDQKSKAQKEEEVSEMLQLSVNEDERYEVYLPWKEGHPELTDNWTTAERRLQSVTRHLSRINKLEEYHEVFEKWLEDGIIEVDREATTAGYFLPHHAVIKEASETTKIRPVFDASSRDARGNSLNSCLETGPNLIELIPKLLLQFRKKAIGITADIAKAFLQISVASVDRKFLKFLWWKSRDLQDVVILRHCRVVFGVAPSPFLLSATLRHHLEQAPEELKETAEKLKKSFYVDNCVTSVDSEEELRKFIKEANKLMSSAKFELRGWCSSQLHKGAEETLNTFVPVLGLLWDTNSDEIFCDIDSIGFSGNQITKRKLLSIAQKVFDPLGFFSPTMLVPKLLLQETWKLNTSWDEELPKEILYKFLAWLRNLPWLGKCRVKRRLTEATTGTETSVSLHVFSDASKKSYAACAFIRTERDGQTTVRFVQARSRVAPLKEWSIPRLELIAALIASRLCREVKKSLGLEGCETYCWSDSSVVLTWIRKDDDWNVFVSNRCREIRENTTPDEWHYIPGPLNPADLPSRGCDAKVLFLSRWWEGPDWLREEKERWPQLEVLAPEQDVNKERKKTTLCTVASGNSRFSCNLQYFSSYVKILRMVGWILRFLHNCSSSCKRTGELNYEEVEKAEISTLRCIQSEHYGSKETKTPKMLQTFEDEHGLIRVRTRLLLSDEPDYFKHPILLPHNDVIIHRMVFEKHCQMQHAGVQILVANIREKFWITSIKRLVRGVIRKCVICRRYQAKPVEPPCAPLPQARVKCAAAFEITGIDMAGPLYLQSGDKVWIVLFTCAVYRAVHLELARSLSTECFLMALRRFIARRGRVQVIYTDNGTNFIGASNTLKQLNWEEILAMSSVQKIKWIFNPPAAPWWGGWWERLVRMVKELLRRILGRKVVKFEELETILCDCEATLNSRPLTYIEDTSDALKPLTPAMFLQGLPKTDVVDLDEIDAVSLNRRLRYLQKLRDDFRQRFRNEYLAMLVHHSERKQGTLKVGEVVLIESDGEKKCNWPLGLVLETYPGADGNIRVARVKTAHGERIRPLQRLYPLEVCSTMKQLLVEPDSPLKIQMEDAMKSEVQEKTPATTRSGRCVKIPDRLNL